jgi:mycothiol synthase
VALWSRLTASAAAHPGGKLTPPTGFSIRRPTVDDMPAAQRVLDACETAACGESRSHDDDLVALSRDPHVDLQRNEWVVAGAAGQLCAVAWIWPMRSGAEIIGNIYVHPAHRGKGLGCALLERVERRAAEAASESAGTSPPRLYAWVEDLYPGWRRLLESRGYAGVRQSFAMRADLEKPPAPRWPQGIEARPFRPGLDDRAVWRADEEAFAEHFLFEARAFEEWKLHHLESRGADPSLWSIAWDGDEVAGYVVGFHADAGGLVGDLAVRRPWRGRGIGSALLRAEFRLFVARGYRVARLDVDAQNATGVLHVYERAGMVVERRFDVMATTLG